MNPIPPAAEISCSDEELVGLTLAGDQDAYRRIVERYKTLVCSVAYNATGDISQSEDLAQETFIAGWRQLAQLREPAKLRSWLCGIARNLLNSRRRRLAREPSHAGGVLTDDAAAMDPPPSELAIKREQEAILWQALERIPGHYREPLILFYREDRSVERVARDLELSEDAVRQRLSRGRKLLHREVLVFVEGALGRTTPGTMFTMSVMGALPLLATSSLATAGGAAAQWGGAGFGMKLLTVFNVVVGPLVGLLAVWLGVRDSMADARTVEERRSVKRYFLTVAGGTLAFTLLSVPLNARANANGGFDPAPMLLWLAILLAYLGGVIVLALRLQRKQWQMRRETTNQSLVPARRPTSEYRSRWTLLGLPLVHVRLSARTDATVQPALGWIAIGNYAFGILFAWGGVAVGAVSGGGLSAGIISIGAISAGFMALGGLAVGVFAMGGVAVGLVATGAFAFGWVAAEGRYAMAREFALGIHAAAAHANDELARAFFADRPWLDLRTAAGRAVLGLVWLPALGVIWHSLRQRRTFRRK